MVMKIQCQEGIRFLEICATII